MPGQFSSFSFIAIFHNSHLRSYFSFIRRGTEILSFNNSKEGISVEENFLYPKNSKFTAIFGVFPTKPKKKKNQNYSYKLICVFALLSIISLQQQLEKTFQEVNLKKRIGIFQSVQDYFSVFAIHSFCFRITTIMWKGKEKATMNEHYRMENSYCGMPQ